MPENETEDTRPSWEGPLREGDTPTVAPGGSSFSVVEVGPVPGPVAEFVPLKEVAVAFNRDPETITAWAKKGSFPAPYKIEGRLLWSPVDLRLYLDFVRRRSADLHAGGDGEVSRPEYTL